jgi:hypothetical protein
MTSNSSLAVSQLDVVGIKDDLISYYKASDKFKDYDYEGSNLSSLLDVMAYNTYLNSFYTNMAINEMYLDSAVLRESIVSRAKDLNYLPRSSRSSQASIDITIYPPDSPAYVKLSKGTNFQGTSGNSVFTFSLDSDLYITGISNSYTSNAVSIYEGYYVTEKFIVDTTSENQRFTLSNKNIDTTSLTVTVTNSILVPEPWDFASSLLGVTTQAKVYFLQATGNNYEIIFGDNVVGKYPINGSIITANYRVCNQDSPNGISKFKATSNLGGYSNYIVSTSLDISGNAIKSYGGIGPETSASIKYYAPRSYQTLDRAITKEDYKTILYTKYPEIRAIHVYGGDELSPPQYGKVLIAVDIKNVTGLSNIEAAKIQSFLSTKSVITISPIVVGPDYTFIAVSSNIKYNMNKSDLSSSDIQSLVIDSIKNYNSSSLTNFDIRFRYSKLVSAIDNSDSSILDNETNVFIFKKINPESGVEFSSTLDYQNELVPGTIYSSAFTFGGLPAFFSDDGNGNLQVKSTTNNVVSVLATVGTIDYTSGIISLSSVLISDYVGTSINIFATSKSHDFSVSKNVILQIDENNINVDVQGIRE